MVRLIKRASSRQEIWVEAPDLTSMRGAELFITILRCCVRSRPATHPPRPPLHSNEPNAPGRPPPVWGRFFGRSKKPARAEDRPGGTLSGRALEDRGDEGNEENNKEDEEQNSRHAGSGRGHPTKTEDARHQGDDGKDQRPIKHVRLPSFGCAPGGGTAPPLLTTRFVHLCCNAA